MVLVMVFLTYWKKWNNWAINQEPVHLVTRLQNNEKKNRKTLEPITQRNEGIISLNYNIKQKSMITSAPRFMFTTKILKSWFHYQVWVLVPYRSKTKNYMPLENLGFTLASVLVSWLVTGVTLY